MRTGVEFEVSDEERRQLEAIAADRNSKQKHAQRARIVVLSGDGGDHGCDRGVEADGVAQAGAVHG